MHVTCDMVHWWRTLSRCVECLEYIRIHREHLQKICFLLSINLDLVWIDGAHQLKYEVAFKPIKSGCFKKKYNWKTSQKQSVVLPIAFTEFESTCEDRIEGMVTNECYKFWNLPIQIYQFTNVFIKLVPISTFIPLKYFMTHEA